MNDYEAYSVEPPAERLTAEAEEQNKIASSIGIIEDILEWFDANIALYSSVDALNVDDETSDTDAKVAILLSKRLKAAFEGKAQAFRTDFNMYMEAKKLIHL